MRKETTEKFLDSTAVNFVWSLKILGVLVTMGMAFSIPYSMYLVFGWEGVLVFVAVIIVVAFIVSFPFVLAWAGNRIDNIKRKEEALREAIRTGSTVINPTVAEPVYSQKDINFYREMLIEETKKREGLEKENKCLIQEFGKILKEKIEVKNNVVSKNSISQLEV